MSTREKVDPSLRARLRQLPALGWTHARAFGGAAVDELRRAGDERRSEDVPRWVGALRLLASVLLLPMSFPVIAAAWVRRGVYATDDGRALVVVKLRSAWREIGAILLVFAVLGATFIGLCLVLVEVAFTVGSPTLLAVMQVAPVVALVWFLLGSLLILVPALTSGNSVSPIGPETPNGARWVVESLAARAPGDGLDAFLLARKTLVAFPSGSILVAGARTPSLLDAYVKLGFTHGRSNRVYKRVL